MHGDIDISQTARDLPLDEARALMPFRISLPTWIPDGFALEPIASVTDPSHATLNCPDNMREYARTLLAYSASLQWSRDRRRSFYIDYVAYPYRKENESPGDSVRVSERRQVFAVKTDEQFELPDELPGGLPEKLPGEPPNESPNSSATVSHHRQVFTVKIDGHSELPDKLPDKLLKKLLGKLSDKLSGKPQEKRPDELPGELQAREERVEINGAPARLMRMPMLKRDDHGLRPTGRSDALSIEWDRDNVHYTVREFESGLTVEVLMRIAASIK